MMRKALLIFLLLHWGFELLTQTDSSSIYFNQGLSFQHDRKYADALNTFQRALSTIPESSDSMRSVVHHHIGLNAYYLRDRTAAIAAWKNAIRYREKFLPKNDLQIIKAQINIANSYITLNDFWQAKTILLKSLALLHSRTNEDLHQLARVYESLGMVSRQLSDLQSAKEYLTQSYELRKKQYSNQPSRLVNIATRLFDVFKDLGDTKEMIRTANHALQYALEAPKNADPYHINLANGHNNLGIAYAADGQTLQAIAQFQKSITINSKKSEREEFIGLAYNNLISEFNILGEEARALTYAEKAKSIFQNDSSFYVHLSETYIEEGDVHFDADRYTEARESYQQSIDNQIIQRSKEGESLHPDQAIKGSLNTLLDALYKKGQCYQLEGNLESAWQTVSELLAIADSRKNLLSDLSSKSYLLSSNKKFYELAVEIQYAFHKKDGEAEHIEEALKLFEASKAGILFDALMQNVWSSENPDLKNLFERERIMYERISAKQVRNESHSDSVLLWRSEITKLRDSIWQQLSEKPAETASQIDTKSLQIMCRDQAAAIIQFFVGEENTYVLSASKDSVCFELVSPNNFLDETVEQFLKNLTDHQSAAELYLSKGLDLYDLVLRPFTTDVQSLVVIPDGILANVPFEALPCDDLKKGYRNMNYLINRSSVRYASSLSVLLLQMSASRSKLKAHFVGLGTNYAENEGLTNLPHAVEELIAINVMVEGDLLLQEQATKQHFLEVKDQYRNIHLSLHAFTNDVSPPLSYLQFSVADSILDHGRLYASEVYQLKLEADMVVLSACKTGSGKFNNGSGVIGLAHAFAYAGSKSTMISLWEISSISTAEILTSFYQELDRSQRKDEALQKAKLSYISEVKATELTHPFYWAGLVHYGSPDAFPFATTPFIAIFVCTLAFLAIAYLIFRKRLVPSV